MRPIGFSTGALAKADFRRALDLLRTHSIDVVELSALRIDELEPLIEALPVLPLQRYSYVAVHAPSKYAVHMEPWVVERLTKAIHLGYRVVVHPDVIHRWSLWAPFGDLLLLENMDKRKAAARTLAEMLEVFEKLPDAGFCFDIGHARQIDPSMVEASALLRTLAPRLTQVHMSEVNTASRHDPISFNAVTAFQSVANYIDEDIPIIIESLIDSGQSDIKTEISRANQALGTVALEPVER